MFERAFMFVVLNARLFVLVERAFIVSFFVLNARFVSTRVYFVCQRAFYFLFERALMCC